MKNLIVACGSGVATSQTVASKLSRLLKERGCSCTVEAVDMKSLDRYLAGPDVAGYVYITRPLKDYKVPVYNGIAFFDGDETRRRTAEDHHGSEAVVQPGGSGK